MSPGKDPLNDERPMPLVRLTEAEIVALRAAFDRVLAPLGDVRVYLFGSRARRDQKGGDIDLLVVCASKPIAATTQLTRLLCMAVEDEIGEQKIDVARDVPGNDNAVIQIAKQQGVLLWRTTAAT